MPVLADAAQLASLADETPEGRSIVVLAKEKYGLRGRQVNEAKATFIAFSARTRISGVDMDGRKVRKGTARLSYALPMASSMRSLVHSRTFSGIASNCVSTTKVARASDSSLFGFMM